jgi:hypothetical protein
LRRFKLCNFTGICFYDFMSPIQSVTTSLANRLVFGGIIVFFIGCSHSHQNLNEITPAQKLWYETEFAYKTNDLNAYNFCLHARSELEQMSKARPKDLDYTYCLAFLNSRLFLMARSLGKTNAANQFLLESGYCFNENRKEANLPMTNFSVETIEYYVKIRDAKLHPAGTNGTQ